MKKSILLLNIGTPENADGKSVKKYLREFLSDKRVIDIPWLFRYVLVNFIIVPFRYKKSTEAYQKIWGNDGSPLLSNSIALQKKLRVLLGDDYQVEIAMRYGEPSIAHVLKKFSQMTDLTILPMFPQYSSAATGSAVEEVFTIIKNHWNVPAVRVIDHFYENPGFIAVFAEVIKTNVDFDKIDKLIFSYHGLPERHITKSDCHAHCDKVNDCPVVTDANAYCYRAQCFATSKAIAENLHLSSEKYMTTFQSRLGRTPWIKPYTDLVLPELAAQGLKHIAISCPSFVADCLETLEEIAIRAREQWLELGGESLTFVPSLNANERWVDAVAELIRD